MSKRSADHQLTKDEFDAGSDDDEQQQGTWREASAETMAHRTIVKPRRKGMSAPADATASTAVPAWNFAAPGASSSAAAPNALEKLAQAQAKFWECQACLVSNSISDAKCKACETPNPKPIVSAPSSVGVAPPGSSAPSFTFGAAHNKQEKDNATNGKNALERLAEKQNQFWECPSCLVSNKKSLAKCAACEEPNPSPPSSSGDAGSSSVGASSAPTFTFGTTVLPTTTFSFTPANNTQSANTGFSFGSTTPSFSFGSASTSASFSFGSTPSFGFGGSFASAPAGDFDTGGLAHFEESSTAGIADAKSEKNEQFKDKQAESSGEENDTILHKQVCRVYQLKSVPKKSESGESTESETKYVEIGQGELHVNTIALAEAASKKARLVLRAEKTQRLVLNSPVLTALNPEITNEKWIRFASVDLEGKMATFLLKFKQKSEAADVIAAIQRAIDYVNSA